MTALAPSCYLCTSQVTHYRWLPLAPSFLPEGKSSVKGDPRSPSSPLQENSRQMCGAGHCDTPTTLAWCQQKSSQDSASSPSQAAWIIETCTHPLALSRKHFSFSAGLWGFCDSNSIKQSAIESSEKASVCKQWRKHSTSLSASKRMKKVKARKATASKITACLLTINIPTHLIHFTAHLVSHIYLTGMF